MERAELVEIYRACWNAQSKYHRNVNKLVFMALQPNSAGVWEQYESDLETYKEASVKATKEWTIAANGLTTQEIVSIVTEVVGEFKTK